MLAIRLGQLGLVAVFAVVSATPPAARQARNPPAGGPQELVDFAVVTEEGQPVTDLAPSEVTLRIDGRARVVGSLQFIQLSSPTPIDRGTRLSPPLPAPYGSNRLEDSGRFVMIVIDRDSIRPGRERPAREAALRFLSGLSPRDRVGLVTLPRVEVEPTNDHEQVRQALLQMTGQAPQERAASDAACRGRVVLNTLSGLLGTLALTDGPKTVAVVSTGLAPPTRDAPLNRPPGQCEIRSVDFDEVTAAAAAARAHFYVIQPNDEGIDSASSSLVDQNASRFQSGDNDLAGLQHLAGATGGELFRLSSVDAGRVFGRVSMESSAYYVIAFEPEPGERNGLPHRVDIKVSRDRVTVRMQPQFTIAKSDTKPSDITPQRMLREARQYRELSLRATAYSSLNTGDSRLKIIGAGEAADPSVTLASAAIGLFDAKGKLAAQWTADKEELAARPLVAALVGSVGPYRLRVAAIDSTGRRGTVDYGFLADLESAGPLKLSAIALGVLRPGFQPRLQFGDESAAVGYFEIYGVPPRASEITVRMEIVETSDSVPLVSSSARLQPTSDEARRLAIASLTLTPLAPGDYLVRAIVSIDGRPAGQVIRTLRKVKT